MTPPAPEQALEFSDRWQPVLVSADPRPALDAALDGEPLADVATPAALAHELAPMFRETVGLIFDAIIPPDRESLPPPQAIGLKLVALACILDAPVIRGQSLRQLAPSLGVTAAALSKHQTEISDRLGFRAPNQPSERARENQSGAQIGNDAARDAREFGRLVAKAKRAARAREAARTK